MFKRSDCRNALNNKGYGRMQDQGDLIWGRLKGAAAAETMTGESVDSAEDQDSDTIFSSSCNEAAHSDNLGGLVAGFVVVVVRGP